jgi:hypothetical protein
MLAHFRPFRNGDYTVTIDVVKPALGLTDIKQTVHANYLLCGLERFPALFAAMASIGCAIVGSIPTYFVGKQLVRHGIWRDPSSY